MMFAAPKVPIFFAVVCFLVLGVSGSIADAQNLDFSLPRLGEGERVELHDYQGDIVVLDFFAYWCAPCLEASPKLESGIETHYANRGGNRNGIPVHLVAISVDESHPDKTIEFVEKTGLETVLADPEGIVFDRYGGSGIPFVVVLDMTGASPSIVYQSAGLNSLDELREAIDSVSTTDALPVTPIDLMQSSEPLPVCAPDDPGCEALILPVSDFSITGVTTHDVALGSTLLDSSDVKLVDSIVQYTMTHPNYRISASLLHGFVDVDFKPFDAVLDRRTVKKDRYGAEAAGHFKVSDSLVWTVGGGAYDGFADYQSVWLNEFYRQLYDELPEYEDADPWGYSASSDLRWEYLPASGFVQASVGFQHDVIAPAYERDLSTFPPRLERSDDTYDTVSAGLTFENVLTKRLRTLQELQVRKTTTRDARFSLKSSFNLALSESLVWRSEFSGSTESPSFSSWACGSAVEYDWNETWFLSLSGRYYEDTGQVELTLPGDSSAPSVRTYQAALGLRRAGVHNSLKFSIGPYISKYLEDPADREFDNLYKDRDWLYVDVAYMYRF